MGAQDVKADTVGLKRLEFVRSYASYFTGLASSAYSTTKAHLPEQLGPTIKTIEDKASAFKPYVTSAQDKSDSLLKGVDGQVDYVVKNGSSVLGDQKGFLNQKLQAQRKFHENNLQHFNSSRSAILDRISSGVNWFKSHGLNGTLSVAVDNSKATYAKVTKSLSSTWEEISKTPLVSKASTQYLQLHDAALATPTYHQLFDFISKTQEKFYSVPAVKKVSSNVDPYLSSIYENSYYTAAKDHLKPVSSAKKTATQ
ncbi:hypothetical protein WJX84_002431 [Apatococcus fuscideae]|uniref:Uncharacterized protein n=1 Tax=Apatococcus fuscideae TaxID=2026836 RepID=A0AAW1T5A0_9CHLO